MYRKRHAVEIAHELSDHLIYLNRNYIGETIGTPVLMRKTDFFEQFYPCEADLFPINNAIRFMLNEVEMIRIDGNGRFFVNGRLTDVDTTEGVKKLYAAMYEVYYTQKKPDPVVWDGA